MVKFSNLNQRLSTDIKSSEDTKASTMMRTVKKGTGRKKCHDQWQL